MFPIGRFVAVFSDVPGEDANLIVIVGQTVVRFGDHAKILWNVLPCALFARVRYLIEHEESNKALAFGILGDIERHIDVHHACQYPAHAVLRVTYQPPIFQYRAGRFAARFRLHSRSGLLLRRRAFQYGNFRARRKLIQVLGLTSWREVQVGIVAQNAGRLHGIAQILFCQLLQAVVGCLIHQVALLDPALDAAGGADAGKALLTLQHLHALSVLHRAHAVVDGGHLIAQRGLHRRDVVHFQHAVPPAIAGRKSQENGGQRESDAEPAEGR